MPVLLLPPLVICGDTDFLCKKERVLVGGVIYTAQHFKSFLSSFGVLPHRCTLANTPIHEHALPRCTCREGQRLHYAAVSLLGLNITTIANEVIYFFHHFASPPFFFFKKKVLESLQPHPDDQLIMSEVEWTIVSSSSQLGGGGHDSW